MPKAKPVAAAEFAALMSALGPFESKPRLAVAVSGGADSLALCLLAHAWAGRRRGRVVALTVDHGLRPESAAEASRVAGWLGARRVPHRALGWQGPKPATGLQAAAREARYRLLSAWCRDAGVLHLLLAHHEDDQAETFLFRLERGSGPDGLAAMSAVVETPEVRLLRPLLGVAKARLLATLVRARQEWIEDPSNLDPAYARTRIRSQLAALSEAGLAASTLAAAAGRFGFARSALERATWALLARSVAVHPAGYAVVARDILARAPSELAVRALDRIVVCIGARRYPAPPGKIERLRERLAAAEVAPSLTLGGCRVVESGGRLLVCRETRGTLAAVPAVPGTRRLWDGRFLLDVVKPPETRPRRGRRRRSGGGVAIVRLGRSGWAEIVRLDPNLRASPIPAPARASLPALRDDRGIVGVPHLGYRRGDAGELGIALGRALFQPPNGLSGAGFRAVLQFERTGP